MIKYISLALVLAAVGADPIKYVNEPPCSEAEIAATGCKGPKDCLYPHPDDCKLLYKCEVNPDGITGRALTKKCKNDLEWHKDRKACVPPSASTCPKKDTPGQLPNDEPKGGQPVPPPGTTSGPSSDPPSGPPPGTPSGQTSDQLSGPGSTTRSGPPSDPSPIPPPGTPSEPPSDQPQIPPPGTPSGPPSDQIPASPSGEPSGEPSQPPSDGPSVPPSDPPSGPPSGTPSDQPSDQIPAPPSKEPSGEPSKPPSDGPPPEDPLKPTKISEPPTKPENTPSIPTKIKAPGAETSIPAPCVQEDGDNDSNLDLDKLCGPNCNKPRTVAHPSNKSKYIICSSLHTVNKCAPGLLYCPDIFSCTYAGLVDSKGPGPKEGPSGPKPDQSGPR